jgi:hypothetical protein
VVVTRNLPDGFSRRFGQLVLHRLELHQHVIGGAIEDLALFGQDQAAGMAVEQLATPRSCSSAETCRLTADCDSAAFRRHG